MHIIMQLMYAKAGTENDAYKTMHKILWDNNIGNNMHVNQLNTKFHPKYSPVTEVVFMQELPSYSSANLIKYN